MKRALKYFKILFLLFLFYLPVHSQQEVADPKDLGRMWTFENAPVEWFSEAYDFEPGEAWFDHIRKSSLRFASWCSGSFVSPNGLIMTNHHCSRGVTVQAQRGGEDFSKDGFYAETLEAERKVPGLFVEQLIFAEDITELYEALLAEDEGQSVKSASKKIEELYAEKPEWEGLRIQVVSYYSGAKHSVYGYKRFSDIRLVLVPEVRIGFFGGEEDNFTYPRYNLDFTFWRAYDDNGNPVNSSEHYMKFNPEGPQEGEPVFVVGNPARTERYKTISQLEYDRDIRYPILIGTYEAIYNKLKKAYENDPNPATMNRIFGLSNSLKVFNGIMEGLKDESLMKRKKLMEQTLRRSVEDQSAWVEMKFHVAEMQQHGWARNLLGPHPDKGGTFMLMHSIYKYEKQLKEGADESELETTRKEISQKALKIGNDNDRVAMIELLLNVENFLPEDNDLFNELSDKKGIQEYVDELFTNSKFYNPEKVEKLLSAKPQKFLKKKDPMLKASRILIGAYDDATRVFKEKSVKMESLEKVIAKHAFSVFGDQLSPDATFTLRISDGVVKGYDYNGTVAPWKTSFYGMYDRYYSNDGSESWALPEKWTDPDPAMLKVPVNFVSTNDIIGGNSGSPVINRDKEVVGLIFDGNIESLPGNFIFDEQSSRAISVHTAGMLAALQYIYKADRITYELLDKR